MDERSAPTFVVDRDGRVLWAQPDGPQPSAPWPPDRGPAPPRTPPPSPAIPQRKRLAAVLFLATCATTTFAAGPLYAAALMTILLAHEMGHFLAARVHGVPTSLPYFLPMPLPPIGTLGAVLTMRPRSANARGLFDIAVAGPIAGLVPTFAFIVWGSALSEVLPPGGSTEVAPIQLGQPAVYLWLSRLMIDVPEGHQLLLHPLAFAGWVGLLVTAINLLPIGQLDGGHILYTLAPRWAHRIAQLLMVAWIAVVVYRGLWMWSVMILLLLFVGVRHPPVRSGGRPLGPLRRAIGIALLVLLPFSATLEPMKIDPEALEALSSEEPTSTEEPTPDDARGTVPLDPSRPFV